MQRPHLVQRWRQRRLGTETLRAEAGYRRRLGLLRLVMPLAVAALIAVVVAWPMFNRPDNSFRLGFADREFEVTGRDEMLSPKFISTDSKNQPYTVTAEVAMRPSDGGGEIFLIMPEADIALKGGDWLMLSAEQGLYDRTGKTLDLIGSVSLFTDGGFEVHTDSARLDLDAGGAAGEAPVRGQGSWGWLNSTGFRYQPDGEVFHFSGRPKLTLYPQDGEG
jgi:lipopolysaccharide export system protein LptC